MKFNKTFLTATLLASSIALVGCNEKDNQAPAKQETAQQQETQNTMNNDQALNQFNESVQIIPQAYTLNKTEDGKDVLSYNFNVVNRGEKEIKAVKWFSVVSLNNHLVDIFNVPASLQNPLPANHQVSVTYNQPLDNYQPAVREALLTSEDLKLNLTTIAGQLQFGDDEQIVVTTEDKLQEELNAFFANQQAEAQAAKAQPAPEAKAEETKEAAKEEPKAEEKKPAKKAKQK